MQRWCRRWFFKCLRQHHVKNFATAMQLEQRLKESATAFHLECLATERHHSTFALSHKQKTQPTTFFNIWSQIIDLCLMSYSFLCLLHHFFKFNPSPSFLRYSSLYQVCCYRSYTAPKPQDPRLGVGSSWDVSSFGQLEMASWEWNMSKSCWSFKSWRMGMDAYYLRLLLILVGMSRLEWGGAGSFVDMICGNILFEAHGTKTISIHRPSGCFGSSGAHWIWRCSFSLRPCTHKLGSHPVSSPFFSYICSFLIIHVSTYLVVIIYHTAIALAMKGSARESSAGKSFWYSISFAICPSIPVFQTGEV